MAFDSITLRGVESHDLEVFYEHQLDPEAIRMAAFVCKDPEDKRAFNAHWDKILQSLRITNRTIVTEGQIAGHIACYPDGEKLEVTYWLGRKFWGRGIATQALSKLLHLVTDRPIFARAAKDNVGSIKVLQKCGFKIIGQDKGSPPAEAKTRRNTFFVWISIKRMNKIGRISSESVATFFCHPEHKRVSERESKDLPAVGRYRRRKVLRLRTSSFAQDDRKEDGQ